MTEKPLAFLSLLKLLEKQVGHKTRYDLLDPFPCQAIRDGRANLLLIQNAGRIIAQHAGLGNLNFVISVRPQEQDIAGHIRLSRSSPEVHVEISPEICGHGNAVLSTLAHEIAHKFLHVHGITTGHTQLEEEFLTDITAVYLGFGKLMLNGCECESVSSRTVSGKTIKTTHTLKSGYISRECFAFVYRLLCEMRRIPPQTYTAGLTESACQALRYCEVHYQNWFVAEYHLLTSQQDLSEELYDNLLSYKGQTASQDRTLRKIGRHFESLATSLHSSHKALVDAERIAAKLSEPEHNPHLRYLLLLETRERVFELTSKVFRDIQKCADYWKRADAVAATLKEDLMPSHEIVECPIDKTKLRLPTGRSSLLVTCSSCKYKFIVDTSREEGQASLPSPGRSGVTLRLQVIVNKYKKSLFRSAKVMRARIEGA